MTEPLKHTHVSAQPQVDVQVSGGDDTKTARRGAIFIGLVLVAYIVYLVVTGQMAQFWGAMATVQPTWLLVACFFMFLYLLFGILAYAIAVWLDPNSPVGIRDLISVEASGIFFGNLTPMMMGSTPAQIYRLTKAGQNVGEAGATQFTRFIVYQFGLVAWGAILLLARMPYFAEHYGDITILCVFSFGGHCLILLGIFAVALMPKMVTRLAHWIINLLERVGVSKTKIEGWRGFVDNEIYSFSEKFKLSAGHFSSMVLTVIITMLQLAFFYLVPYFLMLSFGHHDVDFFSVMAASAFVQLLSSAVPLPGGTGGAEGGFALFLGHFYGSAATAGYLLWRLITFIAPTILAAPLLGLKSAHHASIHERWDRTLSRFGIGTGESKRSGDGYAKKAHTGHASHPHHEAARVAAPASALRQAATASAENGEAAGEAATSASKAAASASGVAAPRKKRPAARTVRQTSGGITVSPAQFKKKPRA